MGLSIEQQARAARAYVDQQLGADTETASLLKDGDFVDRLDTNFKTLFTIFAELYGHRFDCLEQLTELVQLLGSSWRHRPTELKSLDKQREQDKEWYMSNTMVGGVCYVDRYGGNLQGISAQIPYFKELGLTYLHLMPLFAVPEPLSDGGYAVSDYRTVNPKLGTMDQLKSLADELRKAGISLVVDFVFNHTSNEHKWAKAAAAGDPIYEKYYWIFPDRNVPSAFEQTTREIFPDDHSGSFIQLPDGRWIWSTFYHFQWDLNYSNPSVFRAMAAEMLYLANIGIDFIRMDAVAFIWKQMNTTCENLPEAHKLLRAYNSVCRIAAPSLLFKSEAIVHPDDVVSYIDMKECQLSYNPLQMALTWEALATRDTSLLSQALERRHNIPHSCAWVNYVRSHDDIGWTFADEDALELSITGSTHRRFLNAFYVNRHPGSFARGMPFQDNPRTGDCRISGTTASLAGLESGEDGAVERILLAYSVAMSTGGVPLIYLGDEIGQLNDYSYMNDPARAEDSRWVHRPSYPTRAYSDRLKADSVAGRIYRGFKQLIELRKENVEFAGGRAIGFHTGNAAVLGYQRPGVKASVLCLANFSDYPQSLSRERFGGLPKEGIDLVSGCVVKGLWEEGVQLMAHQYMWVKF